jgi:NADPH:quinone reductase
VLTAADLRLGQSVLIHGAAGGVGSYAVQLAKAAGAYVVATCGGYDAALVRSLGADVVIDYHTEDFVEVALRETAGAGVDVVFDAAGGLLAKSIPVARMDGQLVTVAGVRGDLNPAMRKNLRVHFVHLEDTKAKLDALRVLFERGQLRSVVGATFALSQLPEAHRLLEQGGSAVHGKIVIRVA